MSETLCIAGGGLLRLVELSADRAVLESETSAPPGSTLALVLEPERRQYVLKVVGCRRSEDGYRIDGRLINVSREQRARLERLIAP